MKIESINQATVNMGSVSLTSIVINTRGYCVFCLKKAGDLDEELPTTPPPLHDFQSNIASNELLQRFCSSIGKYLGASFKRISKKLSKQTTKNDEYMNTAFDGLPTVDIRDACQDCFRIVENFQNHYYQMKSWELQVEWQIRKLKTVMAFAERAVTRRKQFKEQFLNEKINDVLELEKIETFRKELLEKCTVKLSQTFPRILLKRRHEAAFLSSKGTPATPKGEKSKKLKTSVSIQTEMLPGGEREQEDTSSLHSNVLNSDDETTSHLVSKDVKEEPQIDDLYQGDAANNSPLSYVSLGVPEMPENVRDNDEILATNPYHLDDFNEDLSNPTLADDNDIEIKPVILRIVSMGNTTTSSLTVIPEMPVNRFSSNPESGPSQKSSSFCCSRCNKSFSTEMDYKSHENDCLQVTVPTLHTNESEENSTLQSSEPSTSNTFDIAANGRSSTVKSKTEKCRICNKRLKCDSMKAHMSGHANGKHHKCRYCRTEYSSSSHLRRHKLTAMHKLSKKKFKKKRKNVEAVVGDTITNTENPNVKIVKIIYVTESSEGNNENSVNDSTELIN